MIISCENCRHCRIKNFFRTGNRVTVYGIRNAIGQRVAFVNYRVSVDPNPKTEKPARVRCVKQQWVDRVGRGQQTYKNISHFMLSHKRFLWALRCKHYDEMRDEEDIENGIK